MKNLYLFALSIISISTFAQHENALLYKISGNGITEPSYLFGTIHITCDAKLDSNVMKALDATSQMYLELDMDDAEMQTKMMKSISMRDGAKISSMVSAEDFKLLDDYTMEHLKISASVLDNYKPLLLSSMFLSTLLDCKPQSFESELVRISTLQKEPVFGLETVEEQMSFFDQIPYQQQAEELVNSVRGKFKMDKIELNSLLKSYATKDLNEMQRLIESSSSTLMKDYQELLLINRNKNWISMMERISKDKPTFFGVGAAHLIGEEGVISLLRRSGYQVNAVN